MTADVALTTTFLAGVALPLLLLLLQVARCSDVSPISKPGSRFQCPADTEFIPEKGSAEEPNEKKCCKVRRKRQQTVRG